MSAYYKRILVPIDGSSHAETALRHAAGLAACGNSQVILLHCYGELPITIGGSARNEAIAAYEAQAKKYFVPCIEYCEDLDVPVKTRIHNGTPAKAIVQAAQEEQCDLIVMGSRGLGEFSGIVLGSVSNRVLEYSTIPVLVVKY